MSSHILLAEDEDGRGIIGSRRRINLYSVYLEILKRKWKLLINKSDEEGAAMWFPQHIGAICRFLNLFYPVL